MSVRLVAIVHPFDSTQRVVKEIESASLRSIYEDLKIPVPISHARFTVNDRRIDAADPQALDEVPADGDLVTLNVVPGSDMSPKETGAAGKIIGSVMTVVGVALLFTPLAPAGIALIGSGIGMFAGGMVLYNTDFSVPDPREQVESAINLRGSRNKTNLDGPVPLLLGTHRIAPHNGARSYTSISGNNQYLHQLFVVGSSRLSVDPTSWKIGDAPLSKYKNVSITVKNDGGDFADYPYVVHETALNRLLANKNADGSSGDILVTTPTNTRQLIIDFAFNGLVRFSDSNSKKNWTVYISAEYKKAGAPDSEYRMIETRTVVAATTKVLRVVMTKTLDNAGPGGIDYTEQRQYDVRLRRIGALVVTFRPRPGGIDIIETIVGDTDQSDVIDKCFAGSVRSVVFERPIKPAVQADLCVAALKIKASDQLNGIVETLTCVASSVVLDYDGVGTGPAAWSYRPTSNPASLYLHVLTDPAVNSRAKSYDQVNWAELESWHAWCAEKDYRCDLVVDRDIDRDTLLVKIAQCGRAIPVRINHKHYCIVDRAKSAPMQIFSPRNSWDYSGSKAFPDYPHALKVTFVNSELDYQEDQVVVYDDGYNADGSAGKTLATKFQEITAEGVVRAGQAWKEARYKIAASHLRPETHELSAPAEYLACTVGDRVLFSHDVIEVGHAWPRITDLTVVADAVTALRIDEEVLIEEGKEYAIEIRTRSGIKTARVTAPLGYGQELTLLDPIPVSEDVRIGDQSNFGIAGMVSIDALLMDIVPQDNLTARLTMVDYAPEIFDLIDDPELPIPPHDPKISKPGDASGAPVITSVYDINTVIQDLQSQLEGAGAVAGAGGEIPADVSAVYAVAGRDGLSVSCPVVSGESARTSAVGYIFQRSTDGGVVWMDVKGIEDGLAVIGANEYFWPFDRTVDGYPEKTSAASPGVPGLDAYKIRVKAVNIAGVLSANWTLLESVDVSRYLTWIPAIPQLGLRASNRTVSIGWQRQDALCYGDIRYELQACKRHQSDGSSVQADRALEASWRAPAESADGIYSFSEDFAALLAGNDPGGAGYLYRYGDKADAWGGDPASVRTCTGSSFSQALPLDQQVVLVTRTDEEGDQVNYLATVALDTGYYYRLRSVVADRGEVVNRSAWSGEDGLGSLATATATSAIDVVQNAFNTASS